MSHHTIDDLRSTLFDTLQALKNKKDPMDIERARAVTDVAQVIVNTVKVEIDHMRLTNRTGSSFIPVAEAASKPRLPGDMETVATAHGSKTITQLPGGATITRHKMAG
ncbi:MAG: hypothetical protein KA440_08445 [Azonexus sp.]|nr:hypothetical protein [Azonexus sp.]